MADFAGAFLCCCGTLWLMFAGGFSISVIYPISCAIIKKKLEDAPTTPHDEAQRQSLIVTIVAFLLILCFPLLSYSINASRAGESHGCPLPPKGFSESDLIGTWGGSIDKAWDSAIIIREDGRYKQIVNVERQEFKYESDWKPWRVTYSDKGLPYLHLEGFLMCAYWHQIDCRTGNTGITPVVVGDTKDIFADVTYWYDVCQKKWVDTPGAGVFIVMGIPAHFDQPPRGIELVPFTKSSELLPTGPAYELREP